MLTLSRRFYKNRLWSQRSFLITLFTFSFISQVNLKLKSFEKWNAPEENCREGRRGRLKFFSEKENQETQQPHRREGNAPEKNPHCVAVVLPGKDAGGRQFLLLLWCCQSKSSLRSCDTEWRRPWSSNLSLYFPPLHFYLGLDFSLSLSLSLQFFRFFFLFLPFHSIFRFFFV